MRTIFDIGDKVECKLVGVVTRIEISDKNEEYEISIQRHPKVPAIGCATIFLKKDQLVLMNAEKKEEKE
jgi:hypothetical protein